MGHAVAQVRLLRLNALPEDVIVNTFHFFTTGGVVTVGQAQEIAEKLRQFYVDTTANGGNVRLLLSNLLQQTALAHEIRVYDFGLPKPSGPIFTLGLTLTTGTSVPQLPAEVAVVLSFKGVITPGDPPARHRGRIYLGPISPGILGSNINGDVRVNAPNRLTIVEAAVRMMDAPADTIAWSVFSKTDNQLYRVISCFVDDAFDTQRRRGGVATTRTVGAPPAV